MLAFLDARMPGTTMNRFLGSRMTARVRSALADFREIFIYIRYRTIRDEVQVIRKTHGKGWLWHLFKKDTRDNIEKNFKTCLGSFGQNAVFRNVRDDGAVQLNALRSSSTVHSRIMDWLSGAMSADRMPGKMHSCQHGVSRFQPDDGLRNVLDLEIHEIPGKHETYFRENTQMVVGFLKQIIEKTEQETDRTR